MLKKCFVMLSVFSVVSGVWGGSRECVADTSSPKSGPGLPQQIVKIFNKPLYHSSTWGLRVVDLKTNEVLFDQEPSKLFFIGSVRKIFSVGLLLNEIGPAYTYDTPVYGRGTVDKNGVLHGDLVLLASGDLTMGGRKNPDGSLAVTANDHNEANSLGNALLSEPDPLAGYKALAEQVAASGITRIDGEVIIDDRLFQPFNFREEFDVTAIFVNDDVVDLSLKPTTPGAAATMDVRPLSAALTVTNALKTGPKGSDLNIELDPEIPEDIGTPGATAKVGGLLPVDDVPPFTGVFPLVRTLRIFAPSNYARTVFVEALEARGVAVDAQTVEANPAQLLGAKDSYPDSEQLALLVGTPYGEVARLILKVSYNIGADTSLVLFGLTQGVDTMDAALAVEQNVLTQKYGLDPKGFHFVDGSGGGPTTATNGTVTHFVAEILKTPHHETFSKALPSLGVDGSLGFVTDFQADPTLRGATGQVHAKTGTYVEGAENGILVKGQAMGGYIDTQSGRRLAVQLVVNEVPVSAVLDLLEVFQDQGTVLALLWRDF